MFIELNPSVLATEFGPLLSHVRNPGAIPNSVKIDPADYLGEHFPSIRLKHVHIVVERHLADTASECFMRLVFRYLRNILPEDIPFSPNWSPRAQMVQEMYNLLQEHDLLYVGFSPPVRFCRSTKQLTSLGPRDSRMWKNHSTAPTPCAHLEKQPIRFCPRY